jgi:hypothetical protein
MGGHPNRSAPVVAPQYESGDLELDGIRIGILGGPVNQHFDMRAHGKGFPAAKRNAVNAQILG